jgi:PPOX class probable F420-dependent enzyme
MNCTDIRKTGHVPIRDHAGRWPARPLARQAAQRVRQATAGSAAIGSVNVARKIATNTVVAKDELIEFIKVRHHAIVITTRKDGGPQASPVTCGVDDQGRIVIATYPERAKTRNARRDPEHVSVMFLSDDFGGPWVQVDGTAEVLDVPEAVDALVDYFRSISGEHPDWAEYRAAMAAQGKSLLRVTPVRWTPIATGGFPARLA